MTSTPQKIEKGFFCNIKVQSEKKCVLERVMMQVERIV